MIVVKKLRLQHILLVFSLVFGILSVYFITHLVVWYKSNAQTEKLIEEFKGQPEEKAQGDPSLLLRIKGNGVLEEIEELSSKLPTKPEFPFLSVDFEELKERNSDIVAWLRMPEVDIDIPIVQTVDNDFYLSHDVDKNPAKTGWVFADARSNLEHLGLNTVLYGHNIINKQMFGALKLLLDVDNSTKDAFKYISFTTPYKEMVFEIVSVYVTDYEDWKYVRQVFPSEEIKTDFISDVVSRNTSKVFEDKTITSHDKILTFSTCYGPVGTTNRLVVHAKLIAER